MDQHEIESLADKLLITLRGDLGLPNSIAKLGQREHAILVKNLNNEPSYWLVPVASAEHLLGFLRLSLEGDLLAYGRYGQEQQLRDFPPLSHFSLETADREIHKAFGSKYKDIGRPQLVHDGPIDRIAWLSSGRSADDTKMMLFWTFGTSYSRPESQKPRYDLL